MKDRGMLLEDAFKEETPHNFTPKSIKWMVEDVLKGNKIIEMFQTMAIISLMTGNFNLEV
jgi:hypothetical protein